MLEDLTKTFFDTFGIEPKYKTCIFNYCKNKKEYDCENCNDREWHYPQITDRILLGLEEIFAHSEQDDTGFFNGFKVEKRYNHWVYQLTYYKGGYYTCGFGETRKEALLNQFITILNDKKVEEKEKQLVKHQVRTLFKEE